MYKYLKKDVNKINTHTCRKEISRKIIFLNIFEYLLDKNIEKVLSTLVL